MRLKRANQARHLSQIIKQAVIKSLQAKSSRAIRFQPILRRSPFCMQDLIVPTIVMSVLRLSFSKLYLNLYSQCFESNIN